MFITVNEIMVGTVHLIVLNTFSCFAHHIILNLLLCRPFPPPPGPVGKVVGRPGGSPLGSPGRVDPLKPGKLDPVSADKPAPPSTLFGGGSIMSFSIEFLRLRLISGLKLTKGSVEFRREIVTGFDRKYVLLCRFSANV